MPIYYTIQLNYIKVYITGEYKISVHKFIQTSFQVYLS